MFACGKMPMKTIAGGRFTSGQIPACENYRSIFTCETKCQWDLVGLLGFMMLLLVNIAIERRVTRFLQYIHRV